MSNRIHVQDQTRAAEDEALARFLSYRKPGDIFKTGTGWDTPLMRRVYDFLVDIRAGRSRDFCGHLASPQVVYLSLSLRPWTLRCKSCFVRDTFAWADANEGTVEDGTCDACGAFDPDGVFACTQQRGALVTSVGLCRSCRDVELGIGDAP